MDEQLFVIGTGRCGSTLLSNMLRQHPDVLSISEFLSTIGPRIMRHDVLSGAEFREMLCAVDADLRALLETGLVPEILNGPLVAQRLRQNLELSPLELVALPHLTDSTKLLLTRIGDEVVRWPAATIGAQVERLFEWLKRELGRAIWIERSGGSVEYADWIVKQWPRADLIHLLRDGPECAYSMSRHPFFQVRVARLVRRDETLHPASCLAQKLPLDRYGTYWSATMLKAQRLIAAADRRHLVIDHGELTREPRRILARIASFVRVDTNETWLQAGAALVRSETTNWRSALSASECAALERSCRVGMRIRERLLATRRESSDAESAWL